MNLSSWQKEKIKSLADYQETMSDLYTYYSAKFPAQQDFWLSLALPKLTYADWLRYCIYAFESDSAAYEMMRFRIESVKSGLEYLNQLIGKVWSTHFTHPQALAQAVSLESGLIASKFYEIVARPEGEMADLINDFKAEMQRNKGKIRSAAARLTLADRRVS